MYESKGTWFERCLLAGHDHRAADCPYVQGHMYRYPQLRAIIDGYKIGVEAFSSTGPVAWSSRPRFEVFGIDPANRKSKGQTMTIVHIVDPNIVFSDAKAVKITTPAGVETNADEAAKAVDELRVLAANACGTPEWQAESVRVGLEVLRKERDEALAKLDAVRRAHAERQHAPGLVLRMYHSAIGHALGLTFAEHRAPPAAPAAPTPDTVVTLGMLQELTREADVERALEKGAGCARRLPFGRVLDRKLGR